ncbi:MAG: sigma-70 family RNA polymerase sigma factor [Verrucomicrobia bacterium]|nr:MAG: sigma-70 family RNA polymerase sigma factor [Verrucomicrobiota bacterium]
MEAVAPQKTPDDERDLIRRAQRGDLSAYEELVQRHHPRIYNLLYHMTSHREDAQDLAQDVFLKAHAALRRFHGHSSFYTWIYRIAVNHALNFREKRRHDQAALRLDDMDQGVERDPTFVELRSRESPFRDVTIGELQKKLNVALQKLSENHRAAVVLHDIQGLQHHEIARITKTSEGTVRSRLFYARQQLQKELAEFAP